MMANEPQPREQGTTPAREGTPHIAPYDQMQVMQFLIEIQKEITALTTKTDRLIVDVQKMEDHVDRVGENVAWVRGAVIAAGVVGAALLAVVWFFAGDDIRALLNLARSLSK